MAVAEVGIGRGQIGTGPAAFVIVVFTAIALYNVIELTLIIWWVFNRRGGIYFWSFVVATYGIASYAVGFLLKNTGPQDSAAIYVYLSLISVGWACMVTGQSMVLWSRLHLVLRDELKLRLVLAMIIIDAVAMHVPIIILLFGTNSSDHPNRFARAYTIYEKLQVTVFFIQEVTISSIYIYETTKLSRVLSVMRNKRRSRRLMHHLIFVNVVIIVLDVAILGLEYAGQYSIQTSYKALVYGAKLKMEFTILNRLVEMTTGDKESSTTEHTTCERRGCGCGGSASHQQQPHEYHHRHSSFALSSLDPPCAGNHSTMPVFSHPWLPRRPQPQPHQRPRGLPHIPYEAHAYSTNDSQPELVDRGSTSAPTAGAGAGVDSVFQTTEIVVVHERRRRRTMSIGSSGKDERGTERRSSVPSRITVMTTDQDAVLTSSSELAPDVR